MKKKVTRRRTQTEIMNDETARIEFEKGFAMALILLCQDETANSSAQEIMEMRSKEVFEGAGYVYSDVMSLNFDPEDLRTLATIFQKDIL